MDHFFRIFIWIFLSFSACLQARSIPELTEADELAALADLGIELLKSRVLCPRNSTFHTPTDVKADCVTDALKCFLTGLEKTAECQDADGHIFLSGETLDVMIQERTNAGYPPTNSSDCSCERFSLRPYPAFLDQMEALVQRHISSRPLTTAQ